MCSREQLVCSPVVFSKRFCIAAKLKTSFPLFFCQRSVNLMPWQLVMGELLLRFGHQGFRFHFVPSGDFARLAYRTPSITAVSRPPIRVFTNAISFRVFSIIVSGSCNLYEIKVSVFPTITLSISPWRDSAWSLEQRPWRDWRHPSWWLRRRLGPWTFAGTWWTSELFSLK